MNNKIKTVRPWPAIIMAVLLVVLLLTAIGCGDTDSTTGTPAGKTDTTGSGGSIYVAVTGSGELAAGAGNMGYAIIDLATKKVEMVNLSEAKAPHGIIFDAGTATATNTDGRVASETPVTLLLGNAEDGSINVIDAATRKVTKTISAPAGAKLAVCGMAKGPDGKIYLTSMGDGKVYAYDEAAGTVTDTGVGGGDITQSACGINWSLDGKTAYLSNMMNPNDVSKGGYVSVVEWPSGKLIKKIEDVTSASPTGNMAPMAHQTAMTPDGKYLYVTDGIEGALSKVDVATGSVRKIPVGKEPHSIVITPDGKTAYISVRHEPVEGESSVFIYDVEKDTVTGRIPGIPAPLVCGLILGS
ncbi:MAG: YncE family protein [Actinobacteria bacterium]|nr:YncE family protein [Actinomycetota bacterium]